MLGSTAGLEQAVLACFLPLHFDRKVWSQAQAMSKKHLILEAMERRCKGRGKIALCAIQKGGRCSWDERNRKPKPKGGTGPREYPEARCAEEVAVEASRWAELGGEPLNLGPGSLGGSCLDSPC